MKKLAYIVIWFLPFSMMGQGYTNWVVGDEADVAPQAFSAGIVLAGGGGDNDVAMQWMLERADGGDVVVIRASNSDGYNDYFFQELGVTVNSVETIRFDDKSASSDPYVLEQLKNAEVLFIAGGDQYDYYQLWKDTPVEDAINELINVKGITVGGTSAGMAVLSKLYYTPSGGSLDTDEALANPFHPDVDILGKDDFLNVPFMDNVITDTHYDQRERSGRHLTFLARALNDFGTARAYGIACNEYTVVAIDENGMARVFGEWPEFEDYAYFLRSNCQEEYLPETLEEGKPLTWDRNQAAVHVYKVTGTKEGENYVDLASPEWEMYSGAQLQNWFVVDGVLSQEDADNSGCASIVSTEDERIDSGITVSPNPFLDKLTVSMHQFSRTNDRYQLYNMLGELVQDLQVQDEKAQINLGGLPSGSYILKVGSHRVCIQKL